MGVFFLCAAAVFQSLVLASIHKAKDSRVARVVVVLSCVYLCNIHVGKSSSLKRVIQKEQIVPQFAQLQ